MRVDLDAVAEVALYDLLRGRQSRDSQATGRASRAAGNGLALERIVEMRGILEGVASVPHPALPPASRGEGELAPADRPTAHDPANLERFRERRAEAGIGYALCHALYLINLSTPDKTLWKKSRDTLLYTVAVACAIEADGVVFHVGSHLGAGFEAGMERAAEESRGIHTTALAEHTRRCTSMPLDGLLAAFAGLERGTTPIEILSALVTALSREFPRVALCVKHEDAITVAQHTGFVREATSAPVMSNAAHTIIARAIASNWLEV